MGLVEPVPSTLFYSLPEMFIVYQDHSETAGALCYSQRMQRITEVLSIFAGLKKNSMLVSVFQK